MRNNTGTGRVSDYGSDFEIRLQRELYLKRRRNKIARERARRRRRRRNTVMVLFAVPAAVVVFGLFIYKPDIISAAYTIEAGTGRPEASVFLKDGEEADVEYVTDINTVDTSACGDYKIQVRVGRHTYDTILTVTDTTPPVIEGAADQTYVVDSSIAYKKDVTATDNSSGGAQISVDASAVDTEVPGTYPVTYTATDASGNVSTVAVNITIREKTEEEKSQDRINSLVDGVLAQITNDQMTDYEKIWAIFVYVTENVHYVEEADHNDPIGETLRALEQGQGDCYSNACTMKAMLNRAGYETITVTRDTSRKEGYHMWNLVKYEGEWFHIDATQRGWADGREWIIFLRTDAEIAEFNAQWNNYELYDTSLYPATGTVSPYNGELPPSYVAERESAAAQ